ncbi:DUF4351 domain-containing protein [Halomonas sp. AOP13-D3-9]
MSQRKSHDQNFKNLILDYPHDALEFFAAEEAEGLSPSVTITPIRQEQLKERLGDRFHELDVPLLVEWPDGQREALLFTLEEETDPSRFSIHRLAHYTLHLSELFATHRVVPVVIFLHANERIEHSLHIQSERHRYLTFNYLHTRLSSLPAAQFLNSQNIVARLNLPNMQWAKKDKVEVYASAIKGLLSLEPNVEKQLKYIDFVDIYSGLNAEERLTYQRRYPQEESQMVGLSERLRNEGMQQGMQQGRQQEAQALLRKQINLKFGALPTWADERISAATIEELETWMEDILSASTLEALIAR